MDGYTTPQQLAWSRALNESVKSTTVDENYARLKREIEQHLPLLQRLICVRVKAWIKKLDEQTSNIVWKRNRNAYAKCLLHQLRSGRLSEPFHVLPPSAPLPTLPSSILSTATKSKSPSKQQPRQHQSPSIALDEYLGRHEFVGTLKVPAQPNFSQHKNNNNRRPVAVTTPESRNTASLPETNLRLPAAALSKSEAAMLQDTRWQPSKLEIEAQLGASRERTAELEWRLRKAEEQIRKQGQLLDQVVYQGIALSPIHHGSATTTKSRLHWQEEEEVDFNVLDAAEDARNTTTSSTRMMEHASSEFGDVDRMLDAVEEAILKGKEQLRRATAAPNGEYEEEELGKEYRLDDDEEGEEQIHETGSRIPSEEEVELMQTLDAFQQRTAQLRSKAGNRTTNNNNPCSRPVLGNEARHIQNSASTSAAEQTIPALRIHTTNKTTISSSRQQQPSSTNTKDIVNEGTDVLMWQQPRVPALSPTKEWQKTVSTLTLDLDDLKAKWAAAASVGAVSSLNISPSAIASLDSNQHNTDSNWVMGSEKYILNDDVETALRKQPVMITKRINTSFLDTPVTSAASLGVGGGMASDFMTPITLSHLRL